jgi:hypothetical protein
MKKKQACDHLKVKPATIDSIRKNCNLQSAHYIGRRKKPSCKKKSDESDKVHELIGMTRIIGVTGTEQTKCAKRKPKIKKGDSEEVMNKLRNNLM